MTDRPQGDEPIADLREVRIKKREEMRASGLRPYSNEFRPRDHAADVRAAVAGVPPPGKPSMDPLVERSFSLAGRVMVVRSFGKATFFDLVDSSGKMQVHVRKGMLAEADEKAFALVEAGDLVGVEGTAFYTKTGELTILAKRLVPVTKAIRPLAEKWHGLVDPEVRYRQRYLDLAMSQEVRDTFRIRSLVVRKLREYMDGQGFMEVETPMLHPIRGGANARPFTTHHNALDMDLYLRIAPELYLKRLLVGGLERVYEIGKCFRNEGVSTRHNPEFTMLEYYEAFTDYRGVLARAEEMLRFVEAAVHESYPRLREKREFDLQAPWQELDMREAVILHAPAAGARITAEDLASEPATRAIWEGLVPPAERKGQVDLGGMIYSLFELIAEPRLGQGPVAILNYPASISPLSRPSDRDPAWTDRFEVYLGGREIVNAFSELNDPEVQADRFGAQVAAMQGGDEEAMDFDHDYVRALEIGMPPAGGFGLGVDRLVMALAGLDSIREVILFPLLRHEARET